MPDINLITYSGLNIERLRFADYTRTLLDEGVRCGLVSEDEFNTVRSGFLNALGEMIGLYTEGLSTSVSNDLAEEFLKSLLYNTDAALISLHNHDAALKYLMGTPVFTLYTDGLKVLHRHVCECTGLLVKLKRTRLPLPMKLYNKTIDDVIPKTLKSYDAKFAAHRLKYTLDYPLATKRSKLRGIYQVRSYINSMIEENAFCREFETVEIARLYKDHCDRDMTSYRSSGENIFSLVFANAVIAEYLKKEPGTLSLTAADCSAAEKLLGAFETSERKEILKNTVDRLCLSGQSYCTKALDQLMPGLLNAIEHKRLSNFLTVTRT